MRLILVVFLVCCPPAPAGDGLDAAITFWAQEYGVSEDLMRCVCEAESDFNPWAVGDEGESLGGWQFQRETWLWARKEMIVPMSWFYAFHPWISTSTAAYVISRGYGHWWSTWEECQERGVRVSKTGG